MKKPKQVFQKKEKDFDPFGTIVAVNTMATAVQVEIIKSQPELSKDEKADSLAEAFRNLAEANDNLVDCIKKAAKQAMLYKFRTTGRYVR